MKKDNDKFTKRCLPLDSLQNYSELNCNPVSKTNVDACFQFVNFK